jgi:hypothetical protein
MDEQKADYLAWYIMKKQLDVVFIQDARVTLAAFRGINLRLKAALGGDTLIASTIKSTTSGEAGGQIVIVNATLRKRVTGLWSDKTGLGLAMSITIDTTGSKMQILSSYWPAKPVGPEAGGLHNATIQALRNVSDHRSPLDYVRDVIEQRLIGHQTDIRNNFIVVGDLNSRWLNTGGGMHGSCKLWADSLSLSNYIADNCKELKSSFYSRYEADHPTSHIDHILTFGDLTPTSYGTTNQHFWRLCSDHRPVWAHFDIDNLDLPKLPATKKAQASSTKYDANDETLNKSYHDLLHRYSGLDIDISTLNLTQKDLLLEQICLLSVNIVETHNLRHKKSKAKQAGWSPQYSTLCQQLHAFTEARRRLTGSFRRRKWTDENKQAGFGQLILKWQQSADMLTWKTKKDKEDALDSTGHNPSYWLARPPVLEEIINEINSILAATHGRARKELRKKISNNCAIRELAVEAGKIGKPLASILEKTRNIFDMDILRINDDEVLTDMEVIHKYLTEFFEKWFAGEEGDTRGMHAEDVD